MRKLHFLALMVVMFLGIILALSCSSNGDDDDSGDDAVDDDSLNDDAADDDDSGDDDATDDDTTTDDDTFDDDSTDDDTADDDTVDDDTVVTPIDIAYIYHTDNATGLDFETYLEGLGHTVDLFEVTTLKQKVDFSDIEVFIVDNNTESQWDATNSAELTGTGKPIIALGFGVYVFEFLNQYLDYGQGWSYNGRSIRPQNLSHPIWNTPNDLGLVTSDPIALTSSWISTHAIYDDGTNPPGVEFLGLQHDNDSHYPITFEDVKYVMWGFGPAGPTGFTEIGKKLFLNILEYVQTAN